MFKCAYAIVNKETAMCGQIIRTNKQDWKLDNARDYSVSIDPAFASEYLEKYYYGKYWWKRTYNKYETIVEKDEEGNVLWEETVPVEEYGYTDTVWEAGK